MKPRSWIRRLFARRPARTAPPVAHRRRTARLHLEGLEQRLVPAPTNRGTVARWGVKEP